MKLVYISGHVGGSGSGGAVVSLSNYAALKKNPLLSSIDVINIKNKCIKPSLYGRVMTLINAILGFSGGLDSRRVKEILKLKVIEECDCIWLDGSLFGKLSLVLKERFPQKKIITFFHNVEFDFLTEMGTGRGMLYRFIIKSAYGNELLAIENTDSVCTLTLADATRLSEVYGCTADLIIPVSFISVNRLNEAVENNSKDLLFVGSDFPANIEALKFLTAEVMPFLNKRLLVVGKGMEKYRGRFNSRNVEIIGFVEDISHYYKKCNVVVTPIFSGAGMKVKVAEALNYGKVVIGTEFSFVGYEGEGVTESFLIKAEKSSDYIKLLSLTYPSYSSDAKNYFEENYSASHNEQRINDFLVCL